MHIVIDIETFSSRPGAALAQIAAIAWDGDTEKSFFKVIDDPNGLYSPDTIRWHASLGVGLRSIGAQAEATSLEVGLKDFSTFLHSANAHKRGEARIWTHATFDMPILRDAYFRAGWNDVPWSFGNCMDLRTLYYLSGGRPTMEETGYTGNHNAMEDCVSQKREVEICMERITDLGLEL